MSDMVKMFFIFINGREGGGKGKEILEKNRKFYKKVIFIYIK